MFKKSLLATPPAINTVSYFWLLADRIDDQVIAAQIADMAEKNSHHLCPHPVPKGFRSYMKAKLEPEYLSEEYFDRYENLLDQCRKNGSLCYLYDEGGWPSGSACGQVYASDPERFAQRYLTLDGKGGYKIAKREVDPNWTEAVLPNLLMREVTDKFLELTHEKYFRRFGKHFGKTIRFAFMDEPSASLFGADILPWTWDLFDEFKKRKGYDPEPFIVKLLQRSYDIETAGVRRDYIDVVSQLFVERFMRPVKEWCRQHGIESGGHLNNEDDQAGCMYHDHGGQILRAMRELDLPGVDVIWRQIWPGLRLPPFPKLASSVAHQNGKRYILGEVFAIYGSGLTPQQMKFLIDYMISCGVNIFVISAWHYSTSGTLMRNTRPNLSPVNPLWKHMKEFHGYASRLSYLSSTSVPVVDTALFFDTLTLWQTHTRVAAAAEQDKIAYRLLEQQTDFDYVDDDLLEQAKLRNGRLCIGKASYSTLILPATQLMTEKAQANVEKFKQQGLRVISSDCSSEVPPTLKIEPADWRFRVRKSSLGKGNYLYFVVNTSSVPVTRTFYADEKSAVARFDAARGVFVQIPHTPGVWEWHFEPLDSAVFLVGQEAENAEAPGIQPDAEVKTLKGNWLLKPVFEYRVGKEDYERSAVTDVPYQQCALGDWKDVLGGYFSGDARYRKEFILKDTRGIAFLDLGEVNCVAEVVLNGVNLGKRIFAPYVFPLGTALKKGRNVLEITVTNTLANAISPPEVRENWDQRFEYASPYEDRQRFYENETLASGLYGPVKLRSGK